MKQKNLRITEPGQADLDSVFGILYEVTKDLVSKGQYYWGSPDGYDAYNMTVVGKMLKHYDVRLVYEKDKPDPIATFTLSRKALFGSDKDWNGIKPADALYLSALAIEPEKQGQGIGRELCRRVENIALEQGLDLLRVNTAPPLMNYYLNLDFDIMGNRRDKLNKPYIFFMEKKLD